MCYQLVLPLTGIQKEKVDILKESFICKFGEGGVGDDTFPYFFSLLPCSPAPKLSVKSCQKSFSKVSSALSFLMLSAGGWGLCVMLLPLPRD